MKYLFFAFFTLSLSFAQSPKKVLKKLGDNPVFFIDSVNVDKETLQQYDPNDISSVTVYKDKNAVELIGSEGKDGVIYIETKNFCKKRYWKYFVSKSDEYRQRVTAPDGDANVQYILNERVLDGNYEGNLAAIDDTVFKSIKFISKEELLRKYKIDNKDYGFQIISATPKDLYHGNRKF
ncbi:MAG: hypothetical protein CFE23_14350 [Flavobacterium sp. BFFFF1]|uniref:hypothetical protein n=1 Tax=unclassified Flavobacterium TaxID=196869 RepID=UPI000BCE52FB|nr:MULTISPECIES: hypothetical protein [unclassified Flavobacterium]OYU79346.1 MAG: hypothetical protein CFE23_14350 [Flavobacterium sp. BFFFF1]